MENAPVVHELARAIQACFSLAAAPSPELTEKDARFIAKAGGTVQSVLLRLQKQMLQCDTSSSPELLSAVGEWRD